MFKMVDCSKSTYDKLANILKSDDGFSQENLSLFGLRLASYQPNMIGDYGNPDFYWCRKFLKWIF